MRVAVIMAGGIGQRFWPVSRKNHPKQLLRLTSRDKSLLQEAVDRIHEVIPSERIFVITSRQLVAPIAAADLGIPPENIIGEPCKRNTAGCLAYAAAWLLSHLEVGADEIVMSVLTADHQIPDTRLFLDRVEDAQTAAENLEGLITIGIRPSRPETGYGYIELPKNANPVSESESLGSIYRSIGFREKPSEGEALEYLESECFLWNSGMFFWRISNFISEFEQANPVFARAILDMAAALRADDPDSADLLFAELPSISIDYALMENASNVFVSPGHFRWDDVGSWDALERTLDSDPRGNVVVGEPVLLDCDDCIAYNEPGAEEMAVALVGCQGLVVVATKDGILVVPKERAQEVRQAVAALEDAGAAQL